MTSAYAVTLRYPHSPRHDPRRKKTAPCHLSAECSDSTGEHHTFLTLGMSAEGVQRTWEALGHHVTRVELVRWVMASSDLPAPPPATRASRHG